MNPVPPCPVPLLGRGFGLGAGTAQCMAVHTVSHCTPYAATFWAVNSVPIPYSSIPYASWHRPAIRTEIPLLLHILRHLWVCSVARKSPAGSHKPVIKEEHSYYEFTMTLLGPGYLYFLPHHGPGRESTPKETNEIAQGEIGGESSDGQMCVESTKTDPIRSLHWQGTGLSKHEATGQLRTASG